MAMLGEINPGVLRKTCSCGFVMDLKPCMSGAGWYAGFFCNNCGPYSRETHYMASKQEAQDYIDSIKPHSKRTPQVRKMRDIGWHTDGIRPCHCGKPAIVVMQDGTPRLLCQECLDKDKAETIEIAQALGQDITQ